MTILQSGISQAAAAASGYQIARSLRFNSTDSAYLNRTPASAGNRQKWTWSGWVKRSALGTEQLLFHAYNGSNPVRTTITIKNTDQIEFTIADGGYDVCTTTALFRDVGAWFHLCVGLDSTQATAANRLSIEVNGVSVAYSSSVTQNRNGDVNTTNAHHIGSYGGGSYLAGYLADVRFIDGQKLAASNFAAADANTGVWSPIAYTGTYGTNGFWLKLDDNSNNTATTLGKDSSGNGNNWTPNNLSVTAGAGNDSLVDSPTNYGTDTGAGGEVRGNYATLNPLRATATLVNGNLQFTGPASGGAQGTYATMAVTSGKWYWEVTPTTVAGTYYPSIGVSTDLAYSPSSQPGVDAAGYMYMANGQKFNNNALGAYGASYAANDVIGVALDMDAGTITFYKNGVSQGQAYTGVTGTATPVLGNTGAATASAGYINFGQRPFSYTAPSGFKALNTQNLPTPAIGASASTLAGKYMNVKLYTGNGSTTGTTQAITGLGFQPDLVWIKSRSSSTYTHLLTDAVRGANKILFSPLQDSEATVTNVMNSFDSDGFTVAYNSSYSAAVSNANAATFVGWGWKGGNASVSNNAGTISSTVSANTTAGVSIVGYTGTGANATVGHGLGVAPKFIIVKNRTTGTRDWECYHAGLTSAAYRIRLNVTAAESSAPTMWNSTAPTSSVFSLGTDADVNASGNNYVAYCFAEVAGFSKFGKYIGNGNADGPFVYCGFRPRFILVKRSDAIDSWMIYDTSRMPYNIANLALYPNASTAETTETNNPFDILSNGFKMRGTGTTTNASSGTYVFAAFAEAPFNYARAR